jgi:hypothetical protein
MLRTMFNVVLRLFDRMGYSFFLSALGLSWGLDCSGVVSLLRNREGRSPAGIPHIQRSTD